MKGLLEEGKTKYAEAAAFCTYLPLFHQPWWQESTTMGRWKGWVFHTPEDQQAALLPTMFCQKMGFSYTVPPPFTPYQGPLFQFGDPIQQTRYISRVQQVLRSNFWWVKMPLRLGFTAADWSSWQIRERYTYVLPLKQAEMLEKGLYGSLRRSLQQAAQTQRAYPSEEIDLAYYFQQQAYRKRGLSIPVSRQWWRNLWEEALRRQAAQIWVVERESGQAVGALVVGIDQRRVYYLSSGFDPDAPPGALGLGLWSCIKSWAGSGRLFDFSGSMLQGVNHFNRRFGGQLVGYPELRYARSSGLRWILGF